MMASILLVIVLRRVVFMHHRVRRHVSCQPRKGDFTMQWTTPAFTDLRFGFEITMYIANR
jgi:coenzyme PQQ precursor peptide PqqA